MMLQCCPSPPAGSAPLLPAEAAAAASVSVAPSPGEGVRRRCKRSTTVGESLRGALSPATPSEAIFGEKTIGQFGSFVYLVNQIFGAGILALPLVLKESGWLLCLVANGLVCVVAMYGTLMLMRAMTMIRGNQDFEKRLEYIPTVEHYLGTRWALLIETAFYLSVQSLNVVSIAIVAQAIDHLLIKLFYWDCGFVLSRSYVGPRLFREQSQVDMIYSGSEDGICFGITLGYLINALVCIVLSSQSMEENMKVQYVSFAFLLCSVAQLTGNALLKIRAHARMRAPAAAAGLLRGPRGPPPPGAPLVAAPRRFGRYQYGQLLSTFVASYSYNNMIPSWANEMKPTVDVKRAVHLSSIFTSVIYYVFGYLMAFAYPTVNSDNVLEDVLADSMTGLWTKGSVYVFNLLTVLPGVLVFSITTRYNLVNSGKATPRGGFLVGVVLPFAVGWLFCNDRLFSAILQWSSLLFSLAVNFLVPCIIYVRACGGQRLATRNPTRHCVQLLRYAQRAAAEQSARRQIADVSTQLREYLRGLPPADLDPNLRKLLDQPEEEEEEEEEDRFVPRPPPRTLAHWAEDPPLDEAAESNSSSAAPSSTKERGERGERSRRHSQPPPGSPDQSKRSQRPRRKSAPRLDPRDLMLQSGATDLYRGDRGGQPFLSSEATAGGAASGGPSPPPPPAPLLPFDERREPLLLRSSSTSPRHFRRCEKSFNSTTLPPCRKIKSISPIRGGGGGSSRVHTTHSPFSSSHASLDSSATRVTKLAERLAGVSQQDLTTPSALLAADVAAELEDRCEVPPSDDGSSSIVRRNSSSLLVAVGAPLAGLFERIAVPIETTLRKTPPLPEASTSTSTAAIGRAQTMHSRPTESLRSFARAHSSIQRHDTITGATTILEPSERLPGITITTAAPSSPAVVEPQEPLELPPLALAQSHRLPAALLLDLGLGDGGTTPPPPPPPPGEMSSNSFVTRVDSRSPVSLLSNGGGGPNSASSSTHLAPPSVKLGELLLEPPVDLMVEATTGAEDAYECDERNSAELLPIRIHVYPSGLLRTYHLATTIILMLLLVAFCVLSVAAQLVVDILVATHKLKLPPATLFFNSFG